MIVNRARESSCSQNHTVVNHDTKSLATVNAQYVVTIRVITQKFWASRDCRGAEWRGAHLIMLGEGTVYEKDTVGNLSTSRKQGTLSPLGLI